LLADRRIHRWIRRTAFAAVPLLSAAVLTGGFESTGRTWPVAPGPLAAVPTGRPGWLTAATATTGAAGGTTATSAGTHLTTAASAGTGGTATTSAGTDGTATGGAGTGPPTRVRIPAIRVDSPLDPLGLDARGVLQAPGDFAHAGWYADGTTPGAVGPAVIAGHVDSRSGPAVFLRLYQLRPGDQVQVQRGDRWLVFRVVSKARYPKDRFPTADVYGPTPDAQLRLITCGGSFDAHRRSYVDNVVIYAIAVERPT
jgi:hypothetical protein